MTMLKAGAVVAWQNSCGAVPVLCLSPGHSADQGAAGEGGWLLRCGWAPHSIAGRAFCATCAVAVCVVPSPKVASRPITEWITTLFFGANLLFCHSLVLNVSDFQGLALCDPINLSDVTERSWGSMNSSSLSPGHSLPLYCRMLLMELMQVAARNNLWCCQHGVFLTAFSYHNILELFDHNRLPQVLNVSLFFGVPNCSHVPKEY